jgi:hypothetical protein
MSKTGTVERGRDNTLCGQQALNAWQTGRDDLQDHITTVSPDHATGPEPPSVYPELLLARMTASTQLCMRADSKWVREKGMLTLEEKMHQWRDFSRITGGVDGLDRFLARSERYLTSMRQIHGPSVTLVLHKDGTNSERVVRRDTALLSAQLTHEIQTQAEIPVFWEDGSILICAMSRFRGLVQFVHEKTVELDREYKSTHSQARGDEAGLVGNRTIQMREDVYQAMIRAYDQARTAKKTSVFASVGSTG